MRTKTKVVATIVVATTVIILFSVVTTFFSYLSTLIGENGDTTVMYGLGILFLLSGLFVFWAWRRNNPKTATAVTPPTTRPGRITKWWKEEKDWGTFVLMLFIFIGCHYIWHHFWPITWSIEAKKPFFWISQVAVILIFVFFSKEVETRGVKKRELPLMAKIAIGIFVAISAIDYLEVHDILKKLEKSTRDHIPTAELPPPNSEGEKLVREAFNFLPPDKVEEMVRICQRESGCNQFEKDGVTPLRGRINPDDIGRMQINKKWWQKELEMYGTAEMRSWDINTSDGNFRIAVYLYKKYDTEPWKASRKEIFLRATNLVVAPKDDWSNPFELNGRRFRTDGGDGMILVKIDDREPIADSSRAVFGRGKMLRVKSITGEKVVVAVTFY